MALEGWKKEGETLIKWFEDHYKSAPNEEVAAELDREADLRKQAADNAARAQAAELRTAADTVDPDVETPTVAAAEPAPDLNQTAPVDPAPTPEPEAEATEVPVAEATPESPTEGSVSG